MEIGKEVRRERARQAERERELSGLMRELFSLQRQSSRLSLTTDATRTEFLNNLQGILTKFLNFKVLDDDNPNDFGLKQNCDWIVNLSEITLNNCAKVGSIARRTFVYFDEEKHIKIQDQLPS